MTEKSKKSDMSLFKRLLNNRAVTTLLVILLVLVNLLLLKQVMPLFQPITSLISGVLVPIIWATILYYMCIPLVKFMEKYGFSKNVTIIIIFLIVIALIAWGVYALIPKIRDQLTSFIDAIPSYYNATINALDMLDINWDELGEIPAFADVMDNFSLTNVTSKINEILSSVASGIGDAIGSVTKFVAGLIMVPIILYYLISDGDKIPGAILSVVPTKQKRLVGNIISKVNLKLSQYIRGQLLVALAVAIMFTIGYSIIGLDYALLLGIIGGLMNLIPYVGSVLSAIPAIIIALYHSPMMVVKVAIVLVLEQFIEGRVVSPLILSSNLEIHPVTILFILLFAGERGGFMGLLTGVPLYACLKVVVVEIFESIKEHTNLFDEEKDAEIMAEFDVDKTEYVDSDLFSGKPEVGNIFDKKKEQGREEVESSEEEDD